MYGISLKHLKVSTQTKKYFQKCGTNIFNFVRFAASLTPNLKNISRLRPYTSNEHILNRSLSELIKKMEETVLSDQ